MRYGIFDNHLVIEDEELGILYSDEKPFTRFLQKEFRKDKSLLFEAYYVEQDESKQLLHGQVRYYFQDGKLSSACWYVHGKKLGKAISYNLQGGIAKEESFLYGVLHGTQKFYYEDGLLQAELRYKDGLLHGQSILYYPQGAKKRQIEFEKGKRHGQDVAWDEDGNLSFCLVYHNGACLKDQSFDLVEQRFQAL